MWPAYLCSCFQTLIAFANFFPLHLRSEDSDHQSCKKQPASSKLPKRRSSKNSTANQCSLCTIHPSSVAICDPFSCYNLTKAVGPSQTNWTEERTGWDQCFSPNRMPFRFMFNANGHRFQNRTGWDWICLALQTAVLFGNCKQSWGFHWEKHWFRTMLKKPSCKNILFSVIPASPIAETMSLPLSYFATCLEGLHDISALVRTQLTAWECCNLNLLSSLLYSPREKPLTKGMTSLSIENTIYCLFSSLSASCLCIEFDFLCKGRATHRC